MTRRREATAFLGLLFFQVLQTRKQASLTLEPLVCEHMSTLTPLTFSLSHLLPLIYLSHPIIIHGLSGIKCTFE